MNKFISLLGIIWLAAVFAFSQQQYGNIRGIVVGPELNRDNDHQV